jgi:hypothetical protein
VRDRHREYRRAGAAVAVASIGLRIWAKVVRRPVDSLAILGASAASLIIIVNAVFLQSGSHPAPFLVNPSPPAAASRLSTAGPLMPKPVEAMVPALSPVVVRAPQPVSARHNDPIAELIGSSIGAPSRVMAVQRVLSEFGYGQVKPSGILDEATSAAIEKFERERKLAVTGRLSDRLLTELAAMSGRTLE